MSKKPIRVCEFVGNMNGGGVESVVMNYYRHVDHAKVQFDFVVTESSTIVPREEMESLGARVFTVPAYTNLPAFQKASYELFKAHPEWKIVHAHMNALNVFPLGRAANAGVPVRISHSHSTAGKGETVKNAAKAILKTQANRYPTERFACSKFAGEWLFGRGADFTVVPNAIDLPRFAFSQEKRSSLRGELGIDGDVYVVLHMGRFVEQKNHRFLLEVFAKLLEVRPDTVLLLAGDGPLRSEMERKAGELGIAGGVRFLGQRFDTDRLYSAADAFCLPSLYEGLPVVSVEAQAAGLPILLSDGVTREALITDRARMLPLSAGARAWAGELAVAGEGRTEPMSGADREAVSRYDIGDAAQRLTRKYLELARRAGVSVD